jgi:hypothetical protein
MPGQAGSYILVFNAEGTMQNEQQAFENSYPQSNALFIANF